MGEVPEIFIHPRKNARENPSYDARIDRNAELRNDGESARRCETPSREEVSEVTCNSMERSTLGSEDICVFIWSHQTVTDPGE